MPTPGSTLYDTFDTADPDLPLAFLTRLAQTYRFPANLHVLDAGCGTGRMLRRFSEQGWRVTGLEPDPEYRARAEEIAAGLRQVEVRAGGWQDISVQETYDLIASVNGPFAYLLTGAARADALQRAFRALKPGGVLFLDLPNLLWILYEYRGPSEWTRSLDGKTLRLYRHHEIDFDAAVFRTFDDYTITFPDGESEQVRRIHDYAIITPAELRHLLDDAGFEDVSFYNSYHARGPERLQSGGRMIVSARKPALAYFPAG